MSGLNQGRVSDGKLGEKSRIPLIMGCGFLFLSGLLSGRIRSVSDRTLQILGVSRDEKRAAAATPVAPPAGSSLFERLGREIAIEKQSMFDEGISFPPMNDTFTAFERGWEISDRLADVLDIDSGERVETQKIINVFRSAIEGLVAENSERLPNPPEAERGSKTYRVRPFMTRGHAELEALRDKLKAALGDERGVELFKYVRWRPHMGAFGANEVEIKFYQDSGSGKGRVWFTRRKSMTGESISSYASDEEQLLNQEGFSRSIFLRGEHQGGAPE
jgi:hypothetical protein